MRLLRVARQRAGSGERPGGHGVRLRAAAAALLASALACTAGTAWVGRSVRGQHEQAAADRAFAALQDVSARLPGAPGPEYPGFAYALVAPDGQWVRSVGLTDPRSFDPVVQLPPIAPQPPGPGAPGLFAPDTVTVSYPPGSAPNARSAALGEGPYQFLRSLTAGQLTVYVLIDPLPAERAGERVTALLGWVATPALSVLAAALAWTAAGLTLRRRAAESGPATAAAPPPAADPLPGDGLLPSERTVELHDLVAAQLAERARTAPGLAFTGELAPVTVRGREVLLARVVRGLLDDAVRHARSGVTASLRRAGGLAVLTVAADGRVEPDGDRTAGLALVRTAVHALGGTATAGEPGWAPGACLVVRLPAVSRSDRP
ncbi:hypothetical protein [Kitasatospora viridis]|uniref:Histidine kinase n=1 Tax=Kitasatospora viridis TaxID=281105 RepID=A0A561UL40_9ACTN|nr:hypothetical protein [Kitasatospora viridis]TWG00074.1 hypothetical protein FHX73_113940 [Kitasatospora viridis]